MRVFLIFFLAVFIAWLLYVGAALGIFVLHILIALLKLV